jgi:6,7-dimethyl-8-ribityllumazine synthase
MSDIKTIEGDLKVRSARFAVLASRFNDFIVERLIEGALATLREHGAADADIRLYRVPGAWELPVAAARLAAGGEYDAIIALGTVIRGGTPHFEYICAECNRGLGQIAIDTGVPIANGVLTVNDVDQAFERAGSKTKENKGAEAAASAIEMVNLLRRTGE